LKRRAEEDYKYEQARIAKRQKRQQPNTATPDETPAVAPVTVPDAVQVRALKKNTEKQNKLNQTDEVLHRKANETASMALGFGKKKYSWMTGGGGGGSGASTPRLNTAVGGASGAATPAQPQVDRALLGARRKYGEKIETGDIGRKIQLRDLVHVLENDGKEPKTLCTIKIRHKTADKDNDKPETKPPPTAPTAR
jgi:hypothetical protein